MAPEDRERHFDKALARHFRPHASGEVNPSQPACPDAELLAAYHERLLAPEQMISCREHIAVCLQCQQILAQLEATDELPVEADYEERQAQNVLAMPQPDLQVAARAEMPAASHARSAAGISSRLTAARGANWRWLAPAGALAAGLLLWVSFHETKPPQFQLAKHQQPPAPSSTPATTSQSDAPGKKELTAKDTPGLSAETRATRTESDALKQDGQAQGKEPQERRAQAERAQNERAMLDEKTVAPLQTGKLTTPRRDLSPQNSIAPASVGGNANRPSVTSADIGGQEKELKKQVPATVSAPAPPAVGNSNAVDNFVTVIPPSKSESSPKAKTVTNTTGRQAPQKEEQSANVGDGLRDSDSSAPHMATARSSSTVVPPGATVLWRIGPAGIIQRSTDAGATWAVQSSGVVADLLAGSAPSDKICWIVGRAGIILRTTDGGAHWQKIPPPVDDDLFAVFAIDAQQTTVSASSGRKTYKTSDAGETWTAVPNP